MMSKQFNKSALSEKKAPANKNQQFKVVVPTVRLALLSGVILVLLAVAYWLWQQSQNPTLTVLGEDNRIEAGNQVWIEQYDVENFGHETTGIRVELSGQALSSNLLKNPRVLLEYEDKTQLDSPYVIMKSREIIPLVQVKRDVWVGESKVAFLAHKDNQILSGLQLFSNKFTTAIGWWTDVLGPRLAIHLFADVSKIGVGNLNLKVVPMEFPNNVAIVHNHFSSTRARNFGRRPIFSVGVPKNFPVVAYPGSHILWLSADEVKLDSAATPAAIAGFYTEELKHNSWKTTVKDEKAIAALVIDGFKGKDHITVTINQIPLHTPVDILLWLHHQ
jgi:hypothetical protein